MTSYLIVGKDKKKRQKYILNFCHDQKIDAVDISLIEKDFSDKKATQSIGIDDIKQIQKKIFFKAIKSTQKAVVIEDAQLLTTEAQNALLKVLEEPPAHTLIFLSSETRETVIATIQSRCQIISLEEETKELTEKEKTDLLVFLETVETMPIGDKLKKAEALAKDKDRALKWLTKCILFARTQLLDQTGEMQQKTAHKIRILQELHTLLKTTNVNPRLAIEATLLNL